MTPYPAYRDTGFAAVPHMPKHWNIKKFRHVAQLMQRKNRDDVERPMLSLSAYRGIEIKQYEDDNLTRSKEESLEYHVVEPGQLVVNPMWVIYGAIGVSQLCGIVSPAYRVYKLSRDISPAYCDLLLRSHFYVAEYNRYVRGLTTYDRSVRKEDFHEIPVLLPPRDEQDAIVAYLGRKLAEIDRFIAAKERLIALLCEQKAAIINRAVTRGLDPDVPMRPSGTRWLGEIPAHWNVVRLGQICRKVADGPHFSPEYHDSGVIFLSARNIKADRWELGDAKYISEDDYNEFCKRIVPEPGDVLYTKGGTTGVARVVDLHVRFQVWVHVAVLKLKLKFANPYFAALVLNSQPCYEQSQLYTRGATNKDLGLTRMVNIVLSLPPIEEQRLIVERMNEVAQETAIAIAKANREIELIKEFRTTLIADAVTGNVDVRSAVPAVVEEVPV